MPAGACNELTGAGTTIDKAPLTAFVAGLPAVASSIAPSSKFETMEFAMGLEGELEP